MLKKTFHLGLQKEKVWPNYNNAGLKIPTGLKLGRELTYLCIELLQWLLFMT